MRASLLRSASKLNTQRRYRTLWHRFVQTMAMIVVFCTTYVLILPAITMEGDLNCGLMEHTHSESCYTELIEQVTVCGLEEGIPPEHLHDGPCYDEAGELICTQETEAAHVHSESCWQEQSRRVLSCQIPEHTHEESCYPAEAQEPTELHYLCGQGVHSHVESCYDENGSLICTIPEHTHLATCVVAQLDNTADLEDDDQWNAMASLIVRTDDWAKDLLAMAKSQIGYAESETNVILNENGTIQGYSRYGDWYGNAYQPWDDVFIQFCIHYAGIPRDAIPRESDTAAWISRLDQKNLLHTPADALPEPGSIVFCKDETGLIFPAVLYELAPEQTNLDKLCYRVIAGDVEGKVAVLTAELEDILLICDLRNARALYELTLTGAQVDPEAEPPEETEPEETTEPTGETEPPTEPQAGTEPTEEPTEETEPSEDPTTGTDPPSDPDGENTLRDEDAESDSLIEMDPPTTPDPGIQPSDGIIAPEDAMVAAIADSYDLKTANPNDLKTGVDYIIYRQNGNGNQYTLLGADRNITPIHVTGDAWTSPYTIGNSWELTSAQLGNRDTTQFTWRLEWRNGQRYLVSQATNQRLEIGWYGVSTSSNGSALDFRVNGAGTEINGGAPWLGYQNNKWTNTWYNGATVYFAAITTGSSQPDPGPTGNYPDAVKTGEVTINRFRFFNICENEGGVAALEDCVFEIRGDNGYVATVTSGSSPEVYLPSDIPDGEYTITEVRAKEGYVRDMNYERKFTIKNGALANDATIGTFINHSLAKLVTTKNAEVEDYANRIYQVNLTAESHLQRYKMGPVDLLFVVDQSNSMLFPAGLNDTGKRVTLRKDGTNNVRNIDALNLDKSKMHYIIADPQGTSTVWAVWHDGTAWLCQDASYYAKAKFNNDPGYQDDNEIVIFPSDKSYSQQADEEDVNGVNYRSNGCGLGRDLGSSSLGKYIGSNGTDTKEFVIYQATSEYNRLHHLEESLVNLIYEMSDVNHENRVTLIRFSRTVDKEHDIGPLKLTPANCKILEDAVTSIKTSGGTRQDLALEHTYAEHLTNPANAYKDVEYSYTLLITDGAPVRSGDDQPANVGGANDPANKNGNTIYSRIKGHAADVRSKSHLMTVALGMESVEAGKAVLEEIATDGSFFCALDDAAALLHQVQKLLFESFKPEAYIDLLGDIEDEISDSFYPIAWVSRYQSHSNRVLEENSTRRWVLLNEGDWITLDGQLTTAGASNAAGQLLKREDGTFYVRWERQDITVEKRNNQIVGGWKGTIYLKAKEDFIGGNAIDTNKEADVFAYHADEAEDPSHFLEKSFETPNVNVRLLDMNEMHSEVTVYLGDLVNGGSSPLDSLKYFYEHTEFTKLIPDGGNILNKVNANEELGLKEATFLLRYAMGRDLTEEEWTRLANGDTIEVEYTYDDPSSHGPVGEFTFRLSKTGTGSSYAEHQSVTACQPGGQPLTENCGRPAETYTLHITYDAYSLAERNRQNVLNGPDGPGREVGTGSTLPTGKGTIEKNDVHEVHVISGKIVITKVFAEGITDGASQTFSFTLHRVEDGEDTTRDVTKTITIPAGSSAGSASIVFDNLPRGTYTVTEAVDEAYALKSITVLDSTNAYSEPPIGASGTQLITIMGNDVSNRNVIGKANPADRYTSYINPVNGVYTAAQFTNGPITYEAEVPVEKVWDDGNENHLDEAVYLLLYLDDTPVLDSAGNGRILRLDASGDWKGVFTVPLVDKYDSLENYNYSVREVAQIREDKPEGWFSAILENDGQTLLYYDRTVDEGRLFTLNGKGYVVGYTTGGDGTHTVTNYRAVELPSTGGMGTALYYTFGALLTAAACVTGYDQRRKKRREAVE